MKLVVGALLASSMFLVLGACSDDDTAYYVPQESDGCHSFTTCGTCTPVAGCGWCAAASGQGLCAASPDECEGAMQFTWTWDSNGCLAAADASVTGADGGASTETDAAGSFQADDAAVH